MLPTSYFSTSSLLIFYKTNSPTQAVVVFCLIP